MWILGALAGKLLGAVCSLGLLAIGIIALNRFIKKNEIYIPTIVIGTATGWLILTIIGVFILL